MLVRRPRAQAPGRHRAPRHRALPARRQLPRGTARWKDVPFQRGRASTVVGGTVWALLAVAATVAASGGMFSPSGPAGAAASTLAGSARDVTHTTPLEPPADSGLGRRVVFDQSEQRVWLVATDGTAERSYLVSGSNRDNVQPGSYWVKSRSRYARSYNGSGTFEYFVRFTEGRNAPIGFHSVTVRNNGQLKLARAELGTPRSPGCVEQWRDDAEALWAFAPVGTRVVVTS